MGSSRLKCTSCRMLSLVRSAMDAANSTPWSPLHEKKILQKCWIWRSQSRQSWIFKQYSKNWTQTQDSSKMGHCVTGTTLSDHQVGKPQRMVGFWIAQALYRKIYILDEPTTGPATEIIISRLGSFLERFCGRFTIRSFVIEHNLMSLRHIIDLGDPKVVSGWRTIISDRTPDKVAANPG